MPTSLEDIEKGIGHIKSNMATKSEVIKLIDEKVAEDKEARDAETKKLLEGAEEKISELKKHSDSLASQIKLLRSNILHSVRGPDKMYNGFWGGIDQARNFGLFVLASVYGNKSAGDQLDSLGIELRQVTEKDDKAMGGDVGSTGGLLVPTEFIPNLIMLIEKYGVFRRNVLEYPMASDSAIAPKLSSGLTVYCPGAGVAPSPSDPGFKSVGLAAKKWMTLTAIDSELNEDSAIAIGELVGFLIAQAFAKKEDQVGFLGDGTDPYFGHVGIAGALRAVDATIGNIKSLVVGTGNAYSELVIGDFEKVVGTIPNYADNGDMKWYVHRYFYLTVMIKTALALGGVNATEIMTGRGVREKQFLSYPVEYAHVMPKAEANSQICALLANLRMGAYLGDRRKLTIDKSTDAYFSTDQMGIRGTERVAPSVHGVGDTTDAGPICALITASG